MHTPAENCARLLVALEDLAAQEAGAVVARDVAVLEQLQLRAAPVVSYLCEFAATVRDPGVRRRIAAVVQRRAHSLAVLSADLDGTRERLDRLRLNQRRAAEVGPVYRRPVARNIRLSAVG